MVDARAKSGGCGFDEPENGPRYVGRWFQSVQPLHTLSIHTAVARSYCPKKGQGDERPNMIKHHC